MTENITLLYGSTSATQSISMSKLPDQAGEGKTRDAIRTNPGDQDALAARRDAGAAKLLEQLK
jgi:hypothetical protein